MVIPKSPEPIRQRNVHGTEKWYIKKAFDDIKATIARDVVLAYPDYSMEFEKYTDALSEQLGSVITQGNQPLSFSARNCLWHDKHTA